MFFNQNKILRMFCIQNGGSDSYRIENKKHDRMCGPYSSGFGTQSNVLGRENTTVGSRSAKYVTHPCSKSSTVSNIHVLVDQKSVVNVS